MNHRAVGGGGGVWDLQRYSPTLSLTLGIRWELLVKATPRPLYPWETESLPLAQEAGWAAGPVWMVTEYIFHRDSFRDRLARSIASLYSDYVIPAHP